MTREQYMALLEQGLKRLLPEERDNALQFYEEYFDEAGDDEGVIAQLGPPSKLAAQIVADAFAKSLGEGDKSVERTAADAGETQYSEVKDSDVSRDVSGVGAEGQYSGGRPVPQAPVYNAPYPYPTESTKRKGVSAVWVIILGILALPVGLPLLAAALGMALAILAVCFGLIAALVGLLIAVVTFPIRILLRILFSAAGTVFSWWMVLGGGLSAIGLLLIFVPLIVWLIAWIFKQACKGVAWVYNKLRGESMR